MSRLDTAAKPKLREIGVPVLVDAFDIQDEALTLGLVFEERIKLVVDDLIRLGCQLRAAPRSMIAH